MHYESGYIMCVTVSGDREREGCVCVCVWGGGGSPQDPVLSLLCTLKQIPESSHDFKDH